MICVCRSRFSCMQAIQIGLATTTSLGSMHSSRISHVIVYDRYERLPNFWRRCRGKRRCGQELTHKLEIEVTSCSNYVIRKVRVSRNGQRFVYVNTHARTHTHTHLGSMEGQEVEISEGKVDQKPPPLISNAMCTLNFHQNLTKKHQKALDQSLFF